MTKTTRPPNGPSTTGKPSGGGRGNNSPKPKKQTMKDKIVNSIQKKFCDLFDESLNLYGHEELVKQDEIAKTFENAIILLRHHWSDEYSNGFIKLLEFSEKYLSDVQFLGSESYIINVGYRNFIHEKSGWIKNKFNISNNGISYSFSYSTKNEKEIQGNFVNIFILDIQKKRLQKIAITLDEVEQTTFIINKEFEKISIKNECEIYIEKHYGNETIILDSRKKALEFYETIINIKEGSKFK